MQSLLNLSPLLNHHRHCLCPGSHRFYTVSLFSKWSLQVQPGPCTPLIEFNSVQSLSRVRLFVTPWTAACQVSLSITNSRSLLKLMSIESVMPSNHLTLCRPFSSHLQFFPASGSSQMSQFFTSGSQSIGVSTSSISPSNKYSRVISFRIGSPWCPRDSQESSPTPQFKSINSSVLSFLYSPTLTSIHDYWKNYSFD